MSWDYKRRKTDANQAEIVRMLQQAGLAVIDLSAVGGGVPDLLVSDSEDMWLVEIKIDKGRLNARQKRWGEEWRGKRPVIARDGFSLLKLLGKMKG